MYSDGALCCFRVSWGIFRLRLVSHVAGTDIEYLLLLLSTGTFMHTFHQRLYLLIPHPTYNSMSAITCSARKQDLCAWPPFWSWASIAHILAKLVWLGPLSAILPPAIYTILADDYVIGKNALIFEEKK